MRRVYLCTPEYGGNWGECGQNVLLGMDGQQLYGQTGRFCEHVMQGRYVAANWGYRMYELP